jgi:CubicO group peptidase (beta-lactamase class C family)
MSTLTREIRWGTEVKPETVGMSDQGVQKIKDVFDSQIKDGLHQGAQLVVLRKGQVVVDLASGIANERRGLKVAPDTIFHCFSVTKPFTAVCIHKLIEDGRIELEAPVAEYWPEFGTQGKETATIRHALLHMAGIPERGLKRQLPLWVNWRWITRSVSNLEAEFPPGSESRYHFVNFGFILGEVVRRVTGKSIRSYLQENFLEPLNLKNTYIGLPRSLRRDAAHIYSGDEEQNLTAWVFNLPAIRSALSPASNLNATARDIAVFFQMVLNGGTYAARTYLKPETVAKALSLEYEGYDAGFKENVRWGYGFALGGRVEPTDPLSCGYGAKSSLTTFGHIGQNCCIAWADSDAELVVAFTTNRILANEPSKTMFNAIADAVWEAVE